MENNAPSQEMLKYFMQLDDVEQNSVLNLLKTFVLNRQEQYSRQTLAGYNQELEQNDAAIEDGEFVSHEEVLKRYAQS